ncbi:LON peptidase substrate-binding domain-containing protein [Candidatus Nitrospira bockiana]
MSLEPSRSADESSLLQVPDSIPLFPLPNVVFFPKTFLPLHVFEPRYREMVADASHEGRCIGMVLLKEGWEPDYEGNPPVYEIGCVGRLASVQPLPDGRSNIVLQGLHRYRICEEVAHKSYRQARITLLPEPAERLEPHLRVGLMSTLREYAARRQTEHVWRRFLDAAAQDDLLVNSLCTFLDLTPLEKQLLLEADSVPQRARRLGDLLQFKLYERDDHRGWG